MNSIPHEIIRYIHSLLFGEDWVHFSMVSKRYRTGIKIEELNQYKLHMIEKQDVSDIKTAYDIDKWTLSDKDLGHTILLGATHSGKTVALEDIIKNKIPNSIVTLHTPKTKLGYGNIDANYAEKRFDETQDSFLKWLKDTIEVRDKKENAKQMYIVLDVLDTDANFWRNPDVRKIIFSANHHTTYFIVATQHMNIPHEIRIQFYRVCIFSVTKNPRQERALGIFFIQKYLPWIGNVLRTLIPDRKYIVLNSPYREPDKKKRIYWNKVYIEPFTTRNPQIIKRIISGWPFSHEICKY
jgi:hypothetical protein